MKTVFEYKPDFRFRDFVVEKTVELPAEEFEKMLRHPMRAQDFLQENAMLMYQDSKDVYHCLLVTGRGRADGLLVESEGCSYARYAAYVPQANALRYPVLAEMEQKLTGVVDFIIEEGTRQTSGGTWIVSFDELEDRTGLAVHEKPFLQELLADMLRSRPEVEELFLDENCLRVAYHTDFTQEISAMPTEMKI